MTSLPATAPARVRSAALGGRSRSSELLCTKIRVDAGVTEAQQFRQSFCAPGRHCTERLRVEDRDDAGGALGRLQISLDTTDVFIDVTATDLTKAKMVLNILCTMFSEYAAQPFTTEPVEVVDALGNSTCASLPPPRASPVSLLSGLCPPATPFYLCDHAFTLRSACLFLLRIYSVASFGSPSSTPYPR